ncbi:MAG TPA: nucleotide exchange factor GrpE [Longilinea sp.]|nr:nucleotide exchange factor GrpE [Longilinea sp.]
MTDKKKGTKKPEEIEETTAIPAEPTQEAEAAAEPVAEGEEPKMVTVPLKDYAAQLKEIDDLKQQSADNFEGWQRERADFQNYRKRVERDQDTLRQSITGAVIKKYLVIVDDLGRALKSRPTEGEAAAWAEGLELIYHKLEGIMESEGVQRIPAENEMFDPNRHEAITHEDSPDHQSGQIIEVVQQGYTIGDRVLRPAQVRVAR